MKTSAHTTLLIAIVSLAGLLVVPAGCKANQNDEPDDLQSQFEAAVASAKDGERHDDFAVILGISEERAVADLGEPDKEKKFQMKDCCHEFEIELWNTYHPDNVDENGDIWIHEKHWYHEDYILTVWFHEVGDDDVSGDEEKAGEWIALESALWHQDTEF